MSDDVRKIVREEISAVMELLKANHKQVLNELETMNLVWREIADRLLRPDEVQHIERAAGEKRRAVRR